MLYWPQLFPLQGLACVSAEYSVMGPGYCVELTANEGDAVKR